ncbi:4-amino-4-deoxy-L-arabinose transferase [Nocardioides sp. W7]|uniref:uridine kinase family protein n=1 Tax=Nocardioides sp. W7 TaxID=2931390 RepID=UPI001FD33879|nr:4-amino-4-deoxy-L-arabinose transferase [Nocardioides sp. W7]
MATVSPSEAALRLARDRAPSLGAGRLICVDGPAGSGKTTLAAGIAALAPGAVVVNTDELLDGWGGLPTLPPRLAALIEPLSRGADSSYLRFDWHAGRYADRVEVPCSPLLVLEGVGAGTRLLAPYRTVLVWVSAPDDQRLRRVVERDGAGVEPYLAAWVADETEHFAAEGTRLAADLHV